MLGAYTKTIAFASPRYCFIRTKYSHFPTRSAPRQMAPRKAKRTLDNAFSATDKAAGGQRHPGLGRKQMSNDASALPAPKTRRKTQLAFNKQNERGVEDDDSDESDEGDIYEAETILK
ncbi:hypothetical protein PF002_g12668 [Phytophthora fragariae]|uniref:Uncharacterized protein n=2 Tax=Phytophthora fragariae TaxID=53985 RepID=A0A6A4DS96_9STRA|nr:hypothetical protein PF002_g12668 [Phytophthora fragariae]KAE9310508.1 hypothetical protein PF001_g10159 [Phytophthora fragariae]